METSRRKLLVAAAAMPALLAPAVAQVMPAVPRRAEWDAAMAKWLKANSASVAHDAEQADRIFEERNRLWGGHVYPDDARFSDYRAWCAQSGFDAICKEADRLSNIAADAAYILVELPAPDGEALIWKLDYLFCGELCDHETVDCYRYTYVEPFFDDIRRLAGAA